MLKILQMVQGDDFELTISVHGGEECEDIESIYFSSQDLNVSKKFQDIGDGLYYISFPCEETRQFIPKIANFDITIRFIDGETITALFQNKLEILRKGNKIG